MSDDPQHALPLTDDNDTFALALPGEDVLLGDIRHLIQSARERAAQAVNAELTLLHWHIGQRIRQDILHLARAEYGQQIVSTLSRQLTQEFGRGFSAKNLFHMIRFAEAFADNAIVSSLIRQLTWTHFLQLIYLPDPVQREFYGEMCRLERWSVRALRAKINSMLYERSALAHNPQEMIRRELAALRDEDRMTPEMVFRNPYLLAFLGLADNHSERDLENAIIGEIEAFLLELGVGFAFVARQKHMVIDGKDFSLDLLFYHRKLRRLVAIELKLGEFEPSHKGQLELYLRWLDKHEREPGEEAPIGLILCEKAGPEQLALLQLDRGDIRVAEYITAHLPPELLQRRLQQAVRQGKEQLALQEAEADQTRGKEQKSPATEAPDDEVYAAEEGEADDH